MRKLTQEEVISRFKEIHGNSFDYSKVIYNGMHQKVIIKCNKHNCEFTQTPHDHLKGERCPQCGREATIASRNIGQDEFIRRLKIKHKGENIDTSRVKYVNIGTHVEIGCASHGFFKMTPDCLLQGQWCPKCKSDKMKHLIHGVGINDLYMAKNSRCYQKWHSMIERCYDPKYLAKAPSYIGCCVCDEWHRLSAFKEWFDNPANGYRDGYALDKDILIKGNKVYSPETCCFVPQEINNLIKLNKRQRGNLPLGVVKDRRRKNSRYAAQLNVKTQNKEVDHKWLGSFDTPEEAFAAYKEAKEAYIKEKAKDYYSRGAITKKVYNALMQYEVGITD